MSWKEAAHRWEAAPEPVELTEKVSYRIDHYPGQGTWGLWTEGGTLLMQRSLEDIMEFLERTEE